MEAAKFNLVMAAATSAIVPIVLLFVFSQKFFVQGITKTGLKN
jgi:multiple sugar transport system permease protein